MCIRDRVVAYSHLEVRSLAVAFHFHLLPRGGHILLEDNIAVQQVVHLQLQAEVLVQAISGAEVQRVQRLLPDIAQARHAYRMDAAALPVVEPVSYTHLFPHITQTLGVSKPHASGMRASSGIIRR